MTEEKRFYYVGDGANRISGVIDGDTILSVEETVGILNEIVEENKQLKTIFGKILVEIKRNFSEKTVEITVCVNPQSYDMIEEVFNKRGGV